MANIFNKLVGHGFNTAESVAKNVGHIVDDQAINAIKGAADFTQYRGFSGAGVRMRSGQGFKEAMGGAFNNEAGKLDLKQAATSLIAAGTVGRVASGGGLYKDSQGRTNIIGLPFI